jgi:hypothetical protein
MTSKPCQHCGAAIRLNSDTSSSSYMSPSRFARVMYCSNSCSTLARTTVEGDAGEIKREHNRRHHSKKVRMYEIAPHGMSERDTWLAGALNAVLAAWMARRSA